MILVPGFTAAHFYLVTHVMRHYTHVPPTPASRTFNATERMLMRNPSRSNEYVDASIAHHIINITPATLNRIQCELFRLILPHRLQLQTNMVSFPALTLVADQLYGYDSTHTRVLYDYCSFQILHNHTHYSNMLHDIQTGDAYIDTSFCEHDTVGVQRLLTTQPSTDESSNTASNANRTLVSMFTSNNARHYLCLVERRSYFIIWLELFRNAHSRLHCLSCNAFDVSYSPSTPNNLHIQEAYLLNPHKSRIPLYTIYYYNAT